QWGAQPASLFTIKHPLKVARLVLFGMRYQTVDKIPEPENQYRQNSMQNAMLRPEDGDLDQDFVRRRAQVCMEFDKRSPNGALRDLAQPSPVDPTKIRNATLMIMGEKDTDA